MASEKWTKLQENLWIHETSLVCVAVVRASPEECWRAMVNGRNLAEVRIVSKDLRLAKSAATRLAKQLVELDFGEL